MIFLAAVQVCDGRGAAISCPDSGVFGSDLCCQKAGLGHVTERLPNHQSASYAETSVQALLCTAALHCKTSACFKSNSQTMKP